MKNYLFNPFKDDNEKIESFKQLQKDIKDILKDYCDDTISSKRIDHRLVLFIGCLESYYDDIISTIKSDYNNDMDASYDLDNKHSEIIKELEKKVEMYKIMLKSHKKEITSLQSSLDSHNKEINNLHKQFTSRLNERVSCKDYEGESREYFAHNPKAKSVSFYMLDDDDRGGIDDCIDPICTIYNDDNV